MLIVHIQTVDLFEKLNLLIHQEVMSGVSIILYALLLFLLPIAKGAPLTKGVNKEPATKPTTTQSSKLPKSPLTEANSEGWK